MKKGISLQILKLMIINIMNNFTAKTIESLCNIENLFERQIIKTYNGRNRKQNSLISF